MSNDKINTCQLCNVALCVEDHISPTTGTRLKTAMIIHKAQGESWPNVSTKTKLIPAAFPSEDSYKRLEAEFTEEFLATWNSALLNYCVPLWEAGVKVQLKSTMQHRGNPNVK